jgi:hypothetical protein
MRITSEGYNDTKGIKKTRKLASDDDTKDVVPH